MSKLFIVSFNLIILFAYKLFFGGDVTVEQKVPEEVRPGSTFKIEVEIAKGDREGFAKWQQRLPNGFIATAVETQGATFSFKNQEVKLIWMSIPTDESFTISYQVKVNEDISGDFRLFGKFSYIEENERKDIAVYEHLLTVTENAVATEEVAEEKTEDVGTPTEEPTDIAATVPTEEKTEKMQEEPAHDDTAKKKLVADKNDIRIERSIKHINEGNYEVTLTIHKGAFRSFGKVEEYLPPNYSASAISSHEGIFSYNNKVMKILWMTLPQEETVEVKYAINSVDTDLDSAWVHGIFSYLDEDESRQLKLKQSIFKNFALKEEVAEEVNQEEKTETSPVDEQVVGVETAVEEIAEEIAEEVTETIDEVADTPVENTEEENSIEEAEEVIEEVADIAEDNEATKSERESELVNEISNVPSPETGISYKVQIAASKREVNQAYFVDRHGINESVAIEFNDTWYKYTIGAYGVYKQARDRRNEIWAEENKIDDAFVTAYNTGERITVQEALMISKQKWYK